MDLVTGATGHIGNVLVRELLKQGRRVRALVRPAARLTALEGLDVDIARGDILQPQSLNSALQGVEVVYHLAAKVNVVDGPDTETEQINFEGTENILAAVRKAGVRRLVYASSIYALKLPAAGTPINERLPFETDASQGVYDASKAHASRAVLQAAAQGLDAVIVCPTAVVGPYDFHASEVGRAIQLYLRPGLKFLVDGAYDFVDVRDVAAGFILAADRGRLGETYILGGERMTVRQVTRVVWEAAGTRPVSLTVPLGLAYLAADLLGVYSRLAGIRPLFTRYSLDAVCSNSIISHEKAGRELGFSPRPAREAIVDTIRWFQARKAGKPFQEISMGSGASVPFR